MRKYDEVQELIKRLRNNKVTLGHGEYGVDPLCELAAKELEAITARLVSYDCQTAMSDNIVGKLCEYAKDDHERGCQGRNYDCTCGYDDKRDQLIDEAVGKIDNQQTEIERLCEANELMLTDIRRTDVDMLAFKAEIEGLRIIIKDLEKRLEHAEWLVDKYRHDE